MERVLKALRNLGLTQNDAEIYVYLSIRGPQEARNIAEKLKLSNKQLNSSLKNLMYRRIVVTIPDYSIKFRALPFKKTMALLMKAKRTETKTLEQSKKEILSDWRSLISRDSES